MGGFMFRFSGKLALLAVLFLGLMISACKKDDEDGPTGNNGINYPSDQTVFNSPQEAKIYVDITTDQALAFSEVAQGFALKPTAPQDTTYYDGSWWHQVGSTEYGGYVMDYDYRYQYLTGGSPQQERPERTK